MRTRTRTTLAALALVALTAALPATAFAVVPETAASPTLTFISINTNAGDQSDPHVSGGLTAYTDGVSIWLVNTTAFGTVNAGIPMGPSARDLLSDVSGSRIVFSRIITGVKNAVMVLDITTMELREIDTAPSTNRLGAAIGGDTVAYIDFGLHANGELVLHDLGTSTSVRITTDTAFDQNPQVSPDGTVVVWEHCATSSINCDIWQAVRSGAVWSVSVVANSANAESNPDTNGTIVTYDSFRAGNADVFWRPVAGGVEEKLDLPGFELNPSIAGDLIMFESRPTLFDTTDMFVYDLADNRLFRITETPLVTEQLNDITVFPDGRVSMVWASDEDGFDQRNIRGATFQMTGVDDVAPILTVPAPITVNAASPAGAVVTYSATATDDVSASPAVTCAPASGSTFSIGATTVACTATDEAENSSQATFDVLVLGAPDQLEALITLVESFNLKQGIENSLDVKLRGVVEALAAANAGDLTTACNKLDAFMHEVDAQSGKALTTSEGDQMAAAASEIKTALGCP